MMNLRRKLQLLKYRPTLVVSIELINQLNWFRFLIFYFRYLWMAAFTCECFNTLHYMYLFQTFAERTLGPVAVVIPILVACSTIGALNGAILGGSRYDSIP